MEFLSNPNYQTAEFIANAQSWVNSIANNYYFDLQVENEPSNIYFYIDSDDNFYYLNSFNKILANEKAIRCLQISNDEFQIVSESNIRMTFNKNSLSQLKYDYGTMVGYKILKDIDNPL